MEKIMTMGEILVEIMATRRGQSLRAPGSLVGPYASGAPAIFIDQVARLGHPAAIIGCVGDDDFGWLNIERLQRDGVDTSFGATFVTCRRLGKGPEESLRYANASGALAVRVKGPMEGTSGFEQLDALLAQP